MPYVSFNTTYDPPVSLPNIDYERIRQKVTNQLNSIVPYERTSIERCKDHFSPISTVVYWFKRPIVFDIGANIGLWTHAALQCGADVVCFEKDKGYLEKLKENLSEFDDSRFRIVNEMVLHDTGEVVATEGDKGYGVNVISIDSWVVAHRIFPSFMKIDVEGAEIPVLLGAKQTIQKCKPSMMIETHEMYIDNCKYLVVELLKEWLGVEPVSYQFCHKGLYHLYYDLREHVDTGRPLDRYGNYLDGPHRPGEARP